MMKLMLMMPPLATGRARWGGVVLMTVMKGVLLGLAGEVALGSPGESGRPVQSGAAAKGGGEPSAKTGGAPSLKPIRTPEMEKKKVPAESLEREKFVYLIQNDGKNQVTKVKWREGLTVAQVHLEHHTHEWRLIIELWRGDERTTYKSGRVLPIFDFKLVDRDVMIIGPVDVERRAAIEALPEIKALNLPRDKRVHRDGKF